jgi:hypothetical protein
MPLLLSFHGIATSWNSRARRLLPHTTPLSDTLLISAAKTSRRSCRIGVGGIARFEFEAVAMLRKFEWYRDRITRAPLLQDVLRFELQI